LAASAQPSAGHGLHLRRRRGQILPVPKDDSRQARLAGPADRLAEQHVAFFPFGGRRHQVRAIEVTYAYLFAVDELLDLNRLGHFGRGGLKLLLAEQDVSSLFVLVPLDDLIPRHLLARFFLYALISDAV